MNRTQLRETSITSLAMLFAVMALPKPVAASFFNHSLSAQLDTSASSFVATAVPAGTTVRIDEARSMETFNQMLQQQSEEQFPNIEVTTEYNGNDAALQALRNEEIDLVAIDRTLTEAETEGLVEEPELRRKIAMLYRSDANPEVLAFLGYAIPEGEAANDPSNLSAATSAALTEQAIAPKGTVPATVAAPEITETITPRTPFRTPTPDPNLRTYSQVPWWLGWLSLPALGGLLWWLLRDRGTESSGGVAVTGAAVTGAAVPGEALPGSRLSLTPRNSAANSASLQQAYEQSRIILVPRNSKNAYAYWEIAAADRAAAQQQGGKTLILRVYEATEMNLDFVPAYSVQQFECEEWEQDRHVSIPITERDYVAEVGYTTADGRWLSITRSLVCARFRVTADRVIGN